MIDKPAFHPTGKLTEELEYCNDLASRYFNFLGDAEPLATWEEVTPLAEPVATDKKYPVDWESVRKLAAACPPLMRIATQIENQDAIAPLLGLRYAWSRFPLHARLLNAIEIIFPEGSAAPNMVMEPGCFTGGLLHFLSTVWTKTPVVGFDISPVSLDVCKHVSKRLDLANPPVFIRVDFTQVATKNLPPDLRPDVSESLLILSNMFGAFDQQWENFPAIDHWSANANLVAHWVNEGVAVLLCERHDDPEVLIQTIVENAGWEEPDCTAVLFDVFEAPSTTNVSVEKPMGDWNLSQACVLGFLPPHIQFEAE